MARSPIRPALYAPSPSTPFALYALRRTEAVQGAKGGAHPWCTRRVPEGVRKGAPMWQGTTPFALYALRRTEAVQGAKGGAPEGVPEGVRAASWRGGQVCRAPTI